MSALGCSLMSCSLIGASGRCPPPCYGLNCFLAQYIIHSELMIGGMWGCDRRSHGEEIRFPGVQGAVEDTCRKDFGASIRFGPPAEAVMETARIAASAVRSIARSTNARPTPIDGAPRHQERRATG